MTTREPAFYREFRCLGGGCPLTCCRDWAIVPDERSLADYKRAPDGLRAIIASSLVTDVDGDRCFDFTPDGRCALLDEDGLCVIQRRWGEEHLCDHCAAYPRFNEEYGCLTENSLAVSCPEAARLTMERGIFPLTVTDDGADDPSFNGVDGVMLNGLSASRETAFRLLADETRPLWDRLAAVLGYAGALQARIDAGEPERLADCSVPPLQEIILTDRKDRAAALMDVLAELAPLRPEWPALLRRRGAELAAFTDEAYSALTAAYAAVRPRWEVHLTRLAQALIFRHWPKSINDDLLYGRAAVAEAACLVLYHLSLLEWRENGSFSDPDECLLWAQFSREVEHDENNFFVLAEFLDQNSEC